MSDENKELEDLNNQYEFGMLTEDEYKERKKQILGTTDDSTDEEPVSEIKKEEDIATPSFPDITEPTFFEKPKYHVSVDGAEIGSFEKEDVIKMIKAGEFDEKANIKRKGEDWVEVGKHPSFENEFPKNPPPGSKVDKKRRAEKEAEEQRKAEERRRIEEQHRAEEQRKADEKRRIEDQRRAEERRIADERRREEEQRRAEERRRIEERRIEERKNKAKYITKIIITLLPCIALGIAFAFMIGWHIIVLTDIGGGALIILGLLIAIGFTCAFFFLMRNYQIMIIVVLVILLVVGSLLTGNFKIFDNSNSNDNVEIVLNTAIITEDINFRTEASGESKVIKIIKKDTIVIVTGDTVNGWLPVEHEGVKGWVGAGYTKKME